jgi:heme exporter protein A
MRAVSAERVWKYFGDYPALRGATFQTERGACLALLGRNGAGKTTMLRILAGLSKPTKGEITLLGESATSHEARRRVGYLGHGIGVYDDLSAMENLILFGQLLAVANPAQAAAAALERVGLTRVKDGLAREFSRGMRQRLAVARAFLHEPELLLLDEPFTSLDDRAIAVLQTLLSGALSRGATIIMSTHQIREAMELATDVALLERGQIVYSGPQTPEMLADPGWLYRTYGEKTVPGATRVSRSGERST